MKDFAFLFPGQGSQAVGMGKDLFDRTDLGKKIFNQADEILGYHFSKICFEGPEDELKLTHNTQPALLTVSYILYQLLEKEPGIAAGHSLGEYSAFLCAGAVSFEDALLLVHKRGRYMQEAVPVGEGAMAAIMGADIEKVKDVVAGVSGTVSIANWNSAAQVVISGEKTAVETAVEGIEAPRSVFLPVSAPFHSPLMQPAEDRLSEDLDKTTFSDPAFPVINNVENREVSTADGAREGLKKQVTRPVLWHTTMLKFLEDKGITKFAEIGSGRVLNGLVKRTAKELQKPVELVGIQTLENIENL